MSSGIRTTWLCSACARAAARFALTAALAIPLGACGDDAGDEGAVEGVPGDDGSGTPAPPQALVATIGPDGGELIGEANTQLSGVRLVVPPGALSEPIELRIEGTVDGTPLPPTASAIGPHFSILPDGVEFAVPVEFTVPFDMSLRGGWETPDEECKVWYRDGEGWARAEQIASTPESVTVELSRTTTAGAGVLTSPLSVGCRFNCASATPGPTCLDGSLFCIERIGSQHVPASFGYYSYAQGALYWVTSPSTGNLAIAGFDVLDRRALATTGNASGLTGTPTGEVVVDDAGSVWIGFRHRANVQFQYGRLANVFDAFALSTQPRAIGVAFDQATRTPLRFRATVVPATSTTPMSQDVSVVRAGLTFAQGRAQGALELDGVVQIGRSLSTSPDFAYAVFGGRFGYWARPFPNRNVFSVPTTCAGGTPAEIRAISASPGRSGIAMLCRRTDNTGALLVNGGTRQSFGVGQIPTGRLAVTGYGDAYLADLSRPQITRFSASGAATLIPLTSVTNTSDAEYIRMIPVGIAYDTGLDMLYVVTRGTGGTPEFWEISTLR